MKWVEWCSGAGGSFLGIHQAGGKHIRAIDHDEDACHTLREALGDALFAEPHPSIGESQLGVVVHADLRQIVPPEGADAWWMSLPCQGWSSAGKRLGSRDPRNGWPWMESIMDRYPKRVPRWAVGENVPGMTQHLKQHCGDMERCPGCYLEGYILPMLRRRFDVVEVHRLNAADYGVPQHRRRLFVVAGPCSITIPEPTHGPGRPLPWVTCGEALGASVIGGGGNPHGKGRGAERNYRDLTDEPSVTMAATKVGNRGPWVLDHGRNSAAHPTQERPTPSSEPSQTVGGEGI